MFQVGDIELSASKGSGDFELSASKGCGDIELSCNQRNYDVELTAKAKKELLSAGNEVVLGNCGGYLAHEGTVDEFILGSGFK